MSAGDDGQPTTSYSRLVVTVNSAWFSRYRKRKCFGIKNVLARTVAGRVAAAARVWIFMLKAELTK